MFFLPTLEGAAGAIALVFNFGGGGRSNHHWEFLRRCQKTFDWGGSLGIARFHFQTSPESMPVRWPAGIAIPKSCIATKQLFCPRIILMGLASAHTNEISPCPFPKSTSLLRLAWDEPNRTTYLNYESDPVRPPQWGAARKGGQRTLMGG